MSEKIKLAELEAVFEEVAKVAYRGPFADMRRVDVVRFVEECVPAVLPLLRLARAAADPEVLLAIESANQQSSPPSVWDAQAEALKAALEPFDFS